MNRLGERDDPCAEPDRDYRAGLIESVANWIGLEWLANDREHPLAKVWQRKDWLATAELLSLGRAIELAKTLKDGERFLRDLRSHVLSGDLANWNGRVFELMTIGLVQCEQHRVSLPASDEPGFDLSLNFQNGGAIRLSCKALASSDRERAFRNFADEVYARTLARLPPGVFLEVQLWRKPNTANDADGCDPAAVADSLRSCAELWRTSSPQASVFSIGPWVATLSAASPFRGAEFWRKRPSLGLLVHQPHSKNEQLRFRSKLDAGLRGLAMHCSDVRPGLANAVIFKVPTSISLKTASQFAEASLASSPSVSCVYLTRSQLLLQADNETSALGHEFKVVPNPNAAVHYRDVLPTGTHVTIRPFYGVFVEEEPTYDLLVGDKRIALADAYTFYKAHRTYFTSLKAGQRSTEVLHPQRYTETISWAFHHAGRGTDVRLVFKAPDELPEFL